MSDNKSAKRKLILKYGNVCFIEELGIRSKEDIEKEKRLRYKGKKQLAIADEITYHHIVEKCKGGKATEENGALLRYINHQWFNRLSKEKQAEINRLFIEYKKAHSEECRVEFVDKIPDLGFEIKAFSFSLDELAKKKKYNRAKDKKEVAEKIREWEEEK